MEAPRTGRSLLRMGLSSQAPRECVVHHGTQSDGGRSDRGHGKEGQA